MRMLSVVTLKVLTLAPAKLGILEMEELVVVRVVVVVVLFFFIFTVPSLIR